MRRAILTIAVLVLVAVAFLPLAHGVVAQDPEPVEVLEKRTLTSKTYDNQDGTFTLLASGSPIHYEDDYGSLQRIDNAILPSVAPWDYEMSQDAYTARFVSDFTAGQVVEWEVDGHTLAFQPLGLEWTNDLNQIELISMPQDTAMLVTNEPQLVMQTDVGYRMGTIRWDNAYGLGRDFYWTCESAKLSKTLELDAPLPTPSQYIFDGGNPVVRLNFLFDPAGDLDIYVNGSLWDQKTREQTVDYVVFTLSSTNETIWHFRPCQVMDSEGNEITIQTELRKSGGSLYISARVPYEWLSNATYPIYIDPELEEYSSTSDGYMLHTDGVYYYAWSASTATQANDSSTSIIIGQWYFGDPLNWYDIRRVCFYFDTSSIGSSSTVNSATVYLYVNSVEDSTYFDVQIQDGYSTCGGGSAKCPQDPIATTDYDKSHYYGDGGQVNSEDLSTGQYEDFPYDSEDLGWINKTGDTRTVMRSDREIAGTSPAGYERLTVASADYTGETRDPYINVDYTAAAGYPYSWGTVIE